MSANRTAGSPFGRHDPAKRARLQRDSGLERSRTITKGIAFGSVAAVAAAGVYLSGALPGHTASPATPSTSSSGAAASGTSDDTSGTVPSDTSGSGASTGSDGTAAQTPYQAPSAPAYTPAPAYRQRPVVSSGSS